MSEISALGYLGITTTDLESWRTLARDVLGAEIVETEPNILALRVDEREWRLRIMASDNDSLSYAGWEVRNEEALERLADRLQSSGVAYKEDTELAKDRGVIRLLTCLDPDGNALEFFYGVRVQEQPFTSPLGHHFVTGTQGLGHIVLLVENEQSAREFYMRTLGFELSDVVVMSEDVRVFFTRVNARHHSLAFGHIPGNPGGFAHFMLQVDDIDAVGIAYDKVQKGAAEVTQTLGRHSNDQMLSFYMRSPSNFEIEFGTQGLEVDDASWSVKRFDRPSIWGHEVLGTGPVI
ncbi:VOC family protein [Rhodococcus erythropolis]|uniref:VOC family protein n=1 Tax=Rhodococcus erythropolis TaxID=1833 RepID=UPI0024BB7089|nr:VOC family protein [Rhodococcus erythropolis]MDJ0407797.1 VOC family protein [Rhodococcus erythropolis]